MRVQYDAEVDILTVKLGSLRESVGAEEITPGVWLDRAEDGTPLGLQVMAASKRPAYKPEDLAAVPARYDAPMPLADAARIAKATVSGLTKAIARGRLNGTKQGGAWFTTIGDLTDYLNSRVHEGPGSLVEAVASGEAPANQARRRPAGPGSAAIADTATPTAKANAPRARQPEA